MKKWIALLLVLGLMLTLVACSDETPAGTTGSQETSAQGQETDPVQETGGSNNEQSVPSGELTLEALLQYPASPESDFEVTDFGEGIVMLTGYTGDSDIIVLPETVNGLQITHISKFLFANSGDVKAIKLSNSVQVIEDSAFSMCESIEILVCGDGLKEIGPGAFLNCTNLNTVILNDGLTLMDSACFSGCKGIKEIEIPKTVETIHSLALHPCAEDLTIIGVAGSEAEAYAATRGITFQAK